MGHLKECEARDSLPAGRSKSHNAYRPVRQANRTNASELEMDGARAKKTTFAEDFMLEHSNSGLLIALMGSAGSYKVVSKEVQHSTQYYGFPS